MKLPHIKRYAAISLLTTGAVLTGCGGGSSSNNDTPTPVAAGTAEYVAKYTELKGDFSEDVTLDASKVYKITDEVNFLDGTTLTIPAGTVLYGSTGKSYLAINRGAKIIAEGTADKPIIFTSAQDIAGTAAKNDQGQWGGLTLLGKSTNNKGERTYEAGTQLYGPVNGVATTDDNSGSLKYVIIKYSGYEVEKDKELNGLSLGSVGSGTTIENIAVIGSADDGIEFWGGTVNVKNLYVYNAADDSIDTDQGYVGTIDNAYAQQVVVDDETDSRGIEADSYDKVEAGDPIATVTLKNATLDTIGRAIRLREGTGYVFDNVQVNVKSSSADPADATYFEDIAAIRITDQPTFDGANISATGAGLAIKNDAADIAASDINASGMIASGEGIYHDTETMNYFRGLNDIHEVVGVSGDMVDEGLLDADGNAFMAEVSADNAVSGADMTQFDWVIKEVNDQATVFLSGDIATDMTLSADNLYAINGEVNVLDGATLTIPAGTTLFGVTGSSYLAINRGAKIMAEGLATKPIVFTSAQDIAGLNTGDEQGQWGGLTLLGKATVNKGERTYEAGTQKYGPVNGVADDADSSGVLKYVVVKYTGYEVEKDKELNGISFGGVGSGTVVENIASIGSADDGIELWGGTFSIDGLYVYNAGDDSVDTDQGYVGTIQNVYAEQHLVDDETGSRVIEADSYDTTQHGTPQAKVTMQNAILKSVGRAIRLREGTDYVFNGVQVFVETGAATEAMRVSDGAAAGTTFSVGANGFAIENKVDATAIFHDDVSTAGYENAGDVQADTDISASLTEYDHSWIPGWTK